MTDVRREGKCVQVRFKESELDLSQLKRMSLLFRVDDDLYVALTCDSEDFLIPGDFGFLQGGGGDESADDVCPLGGSGNLGPQRPLRADSGDRVRERDASLQGGYDIGGDE